MALRQGKKINYKSSVRNLVLQSSNDVIAKTMFLKYVKCIKLYSDTETYVLSLMVYQYVVTEYDLNN